LFRLHKNITNNVDVNSNPTITYINDNLTQLLPESDFLGNDLNYHNYSNSFNLLQGNPYTCNKNGVLQINSQPLTINNPSNEIEFKLYKLDSNDNAENIYSTILIPGVNTIIPSLSYFVNVSEGDILVAEIDSKTQINWAQLDWIINAKYIDENQNNPQFVIPNKNSYNRETNGSIVNLFNLNTPNNNCEYYNNFHSYYIFPEFALNSNNFNSDDNGSITMAVSNNGIHLGSFEIKIQNGYISDESLNQQPLLIYEGLVSAGSINLKVDFYTNSAREKRLLDIYLSSISNKYLILFDYYFGDDIVSNNAIPNCNINIPTPFFSYTNKYAVIGNLYLNWGQFFYNSNFAQDDNSPSDYFGTLVNPNYLIEGQFNINLNCDNSSSQEQVEICLNDSISGLLNGINNFPEDPNLIDPNIELDNFDNVFNNFNMSDINSVVLQSSSHRYWDNNVIINHHIGLFNTMYISNFKMQLKDFNLNFNFEDEVIEEPNQPVDSETGMFAINKLHESRSRTRTVGVSPFRLSKSKSNYSRTVSDFIDLNLDGYPDLIANDQFQLTNFTGGLNSPSNTNIGFVNNTESLNVTLSGSYGYQIAGKSSYWLSNKPGVPKVYSNNSSSSIGVSANYSFINYNKGYDYLIDVNGDGLPDRVYKDNNQMKFKFLYSGVPETSVNQFQNLKETNSYPSNFTIGANVGGALEQIQSTLTNSNHFNFNFNFGITTNNNNTQVSFKDINGDGLVDIIDNGMAYLNLGDKFNSIGTPLTTSISYSSNQLLNLNNDSSTYNLSLAGEFSYFKGYPICCLIPFGFFVVFVPLIHVKPFGITIGAEASLNNSNIKKEFRDLNGDGFLDYVEYEPQISTNSFNVNYSSIKRTNKLKTITNQLKGKIIIDYVALSKTYENPHAKWVMSSVEVQDGVNFEHDGVDNYISEFKYNNPYYDRRERVFYGYETVKTIQKRHVNNQITPLIYRTVVAKYHNRNYFLKGLEKEIWTFKGLDNNGDGVILTSNLYTKTTNTYELKKLTNNNQEINLTHPTLPESFDVGGSEGRRTAIALLTQTDEFIYELTGNPLHKRTKFTYDSKARVIQYLYEGDVNTTEDNYTTYINYHNIQSLASKNIISIPASIEVKIGNETKRKRTTQVNPNNGLITRIHSYLNSNDFNTFSLEYDMYGNLTKKIFPVTNNSNNNYFIVYQYDQAISKYITKITDAWGYESTSTYDYRFDVPLTTTDIAGNSMHYHYDNFGRLTKVIGPKELPNGQNAYTIKYEYYLKWSNQLGIPEQEFVPFAVTKHYDVQNPNNDIETITFVDGLGRPIQVKKDIEINVGSSENPEYQEMMSVSGMVSYDEFGRAYKQYHPSFEAKNNNINRLVNNNISNYFTLSVFDELDRTVKTIDPEGNESEVTYGIENGLLKFYTKTPQNNSVDLESVTYTDVNGRTIKSVNYGSSSNLETLFSYNAIGELLSYTDADNLTTSYTYDNFGRKVEINHPDFGITQNIYNINGNLEKVLTQNLSDFGQFIEYQYDYHRLVNVKFPENNGTNISDVTYVYAGPNSGNQTGRLIEQYDATGHQFFEYGKMGEIVTNYRTVVSPSPYQPNRTFKTYFTYDSFNRLQTMMYPDGEKVSFYYNKGGMLHKVIGQHQNQDYEYVKQLDYDHFEQRTYIKYGNNTETFYQYSPELRRLNNLMVTASNQEVLLNNHYSFDKVGNVIEINNQAGTNNVNNLGGTYTHNYHYDKFNRLNGAYGTFNGLEGFEGDFNSNYDLRLEYNNSHGIVVKQQNHSVNYDTTPQNTYFNEYKYYEGTHKVEKISDALTGQSQYFKYDLNGNTIHHYKPSGVQNYYWDEVNRLRVVESDKKMQHYLYDASGERILKASSGYEDIFENGELVYSEVFLDNYTTYPSGYIVVEPDGRYTKHYYVGSQRISSQTGHKHADEVFETTYQKNEAIAKKESQLKEKQQNDLQYYLLKTKKALQFKEPSKDTIAPKTEQKGGKEQLYFYHPDHLGTANFVTDGDGYAYEFFLNLPFGETMVQQHSFTSDFTNRYKFTGKELDTETGLYYYGARFYNPSTSIWLSVDPLAEMFPNWNPYNYVMQNPLNLIDPTGMSPEGGEGGGGGDSNTYSNKTNELDEVVVIGKRKPNSSWTTESPRYSYGGTIQEWENQYGMKAEDYTPEMSNNYNNYKAQLDLEEQNRILLEKLGIFTSYFYIAEDVVYVYAAGVAVSKITKIILSLKKSNPKLNIVFVKASKAAKGVVRSFDDVVANPKALWGKSADEVGSMLGEGWTKGAYGSSKTGWKFTRATDGQSIFYHPGGGRHGGSYYGFSSGTLGKTKIVGPDYIPLKGDKATIINIGN